jgi:membrane protein insertase Oxa1/YidC/SpoIIIJ
MFNVFQMPVHLVYISMVNRLSFEFDANPAILTDGFLWFKDLSAPDPTGILPLIAGVISLLNILSTTTTSLTPTMRKIRKYVYVLPLISVPIWMTFPAVSVY